MLRPGEIIIDSFAGGGGASEGIRMAFGRDPDVAINHDPEAIAMHKANHPGTLHLCQSVYRADPIDVASGKPVGLLWASPDCKHFSKAKGGRPLDKNIRDLAWVVVHYAERVQPRIICLENVEEFQNWGPLIPVLDKFGQTTFDSHGRPKMIVDPARKGQTFKRWVARLRKAGYRVEWRELRAADFDTPTIRKRLFVVARRDGLPIAWPEPTNGRPDSLGVKAGKLQPWRRAADLIDWSLPTPSIFLTAEEGRAQNCKRPLAPATMERIARGVKRYVIDAPRPFIVRTDMASASGRNGVHDAEEPLRTQATAGSFAVVDPRLAPFTCGVGGRAGQSRPRGVNEPTATATAKADAVLVVPTLIQTGYGERQGQAPRVPGLEKPLCTVVAGGGKHAVVAAYLAQHNAGFNTTPGHDARKPVSTVAATGSQQQIVSAFLINQKGRDQRMASAEDPLRTVCAEGTHAGAVYAFLTKYYGEGGQWQSTAEPVHTIPTKERFGLVTVQIEGEPYIIADIGMRMLTPRELFRAQGFREDYQIEVQGPNGPLSKAAQIRMCGNSVCPPLAAAILRALFPTPATMTEAAE